MNQATSPIKVTDAAIRRAKVLIEEEENPEVLHRRAHTAVVEVDEMGPVVGPEHVADVAVTV